MILMVVEEHRMWDAGADRWGLAEAACITCSTTAGTVGISVSLAAGAVFLQQRGAGAPQLLRLASVEDVQSRIRCVQVKPAGLDVLDMLSC